jgi:hypothetical protein
MMMAARIAAVVIAALGALTALAPMGVAVRALPASAGVSAAHVAGTVWRGEFSRASIGGLPLGTVQTRTRRLDLLGGALRVDMISQDGPISYAALVARPGEPARLVDLHGQAPLARLLGRHDAPGVVRVSGATITPTAGGCATASGPVSLEGLDAHGLPPLAGELVCIEGDLGARFADPVGGREATLRVQRTASGLTLTATSSDAALQTAFAALGWMQMEAAP